MHEQIEEFGCQAPAAIQPCETLPRRAWLNALLRLFADMALRLR